MERRKKKTNLRDNRRERRNQVRKFRVKRIDRKR